MDEDWCPTVVGDLHEPASGERVDVSSTNRVIRYRIGIRDDCVGRSQHLLTPHAGVVLAVGVH